MAKRYTKEEFNKLYTGLPEELQEALFSNESSDHVKAACERNDLATEKNSLVAEEVGNVLLGLSTPGEFEGNLIKEVGLKKDIAQKVARELDRFIFYGVKHALAQLHGREISPGPTGALAPSATPQIKTSSLSQGQSGAANVPDQEPDEEPIQTKKDLYRETFEEDDDDSIL